MKLKKFENFRPKQKDILIRQKRDFIPLLELADLPDDAFKVVHQQDKWNAISFIERVLDFLL